MRLRIGTICKTITYSYGTHVGTQAAPTNVSGKVKNVEKNLKKKNKKKINQKNLKKF